MALEGAAVAPSPVSNVLCVAQNSSCVCRGALFAQGGPKQEMQQMAFTVAKTPYCVTHIEQRMGSAASV